MKRYSCNTLYKYESEEFLSLYKISLNLLGFKPVYMDVFFDDFSNSLDDIKYEEAYLNQMLKKNPTVIKIKNQLSDDDSSASLWFKIKLNLNSPFGLDTYSFEWSNTNLNFLLNTEQFSSFIKNKNLIACYCYDQIDLMTQSNTRLLNPDFDKPQQENEKPREFILNNAIDISQHWGRYIYVRGMTFMAAPLMWFGNEYFNIISKEELLKFKGAQLVNNFDSMLDVVHIKLFDLYENPNHSKNRETQRIFWETFELEKRAQKYEADRPIDFIAWYKEKATQKKKKK